jgi:hypothetical protein
MLRPPLTPQAFGVVLFLVAPGWLAAASAEASGHWAFKPLRPPTPPAVARVEWVRNPIDRFILARLEREGLTPSAEAERAVLIRRVTFDLLGLPPTPEELQAFVEDRRPDAYERLVERLLASPQYGERWGRHWLDLVRFTESQGFEYDKLRPNAWHYRDYVIENFNADRSYFAFMQAQIAGDVVEPASPEGIVATSLLVCGAWDEAGNSQANVTQKLTTREEELEDLIGVVAQSFLGLTLNCARCHAHKFDPIPQADYYRVKAVFEGVRHGERAIAPATVAQERERRAGALQAQLSAVEKDIAALEEQGRRELAARSGSRGEAVPGDRSEKTVAVEELASVWSAADRERHAALRQAVTNYQAALRGLPPLPVSYAGTRRQPEPTRRLRRGDVRSPEETVTPGAPGIVTGLEAEFGLRADAPEAARRGAFAAWLVDERQVLPARVMANRLWQHHFGQGLVPTPNDFGKAGTPPSHPELLDWLAGVLLRSGGSRKAVHRSIVTSAAYRQNSAVRAAAAAVDGDNRLLWRASPRRLEAEAVRDAMLMVSGEIDLQLGGPSFRPFVNLGSNGAQNEYVPADPIGSGFNRRTVYRMNVNSGKDPLLEAFDCPDPAVKVPRRGVTTTPLQALALMNSSFVQRQAAALARRVSRECSGSGSRAIDRAYRYCLGRAASGDELRAAEQVARHSGLEPVCWALLNSTEFAYVP